MIKKSNNLSLCIVYLLYFTPLTFFGGEANKDLLWLKKVARACPSTMDVSQAKSWGVVEVNKFVESIPWSVLLEAIESMQVQTSLEEDNFLNIKRSMVTILPEVYIPPAKRKGAFAQLDSVVKRWLKTGEELNRIDIVEFANSLEGFLIILRARERANNTLISLTKNTLTGIYIDINRIQVHSKQIPELMGKELIASLNPIEKTCCKGYYSDYWWRPQAPDKFPVKREDDFAIQGFFQVRGDDGNLLFMLRNNEDIGLVVPVNGETNILFVVGTEPAHNAVKTASDFVSKSKANK